MASAATPTLDPEIIANLIELGEEDGQSILKLLVDIFLLEEGPACMQRIRDALTEGAAEELAEGAHKLKGGAAQLGANQLRDLCAELEARARAGEVAGTAALVADVSSEIERVYAALQAEVAALGR